MTVRSDLDPTQMAILCKKTRLRPTLECRTPRIWRNSPHASAEPVDFGAIVSVKEKVTEGIVR